MTDEEFKDALVNRWFHPSQTTVGGVLWNPGDSTLTWNEVIQQYAWYRRLGQWLQPKAFLEVGVGYGYSTLSLLSGIDAHYSEVHWIDDESQWPGSIQYGKQLAAREFTVLPTYFASWHSFQHRYGSHSPTQFDLIHIDANHEYEHALRDAFESYNYAQKGAHWLFHDSDDPPVAKAAEEFAEWNKLKWFKIPQVRCGLHVVHSCEDGECPILKGMAEINGK